ncbi:adhesion G-protein coupled receptor G7 [Ascaphus truei]|uniref:adhesion G-protein coupled receptor G7 n=1 Tax=Ascaphus truei TaxID=8439 RepID=UPI003F5930EE
MPETHSGFQTLLKITACLLGAFLLTIWTWLLISEFYQAPSPTLPPPSLPPCYCENNGVCENGLCLCSDQWTGELCTIANFCNASEYNNSNHEKLTFEIIVLDRYGYSNEKCEPNTISANTAKATRLCSLNNGFPVLQSPTIQNCNESLDNLVEKINDNLTEEALIQVATSTQLLTSQPQRLSTQDISSALEIVFKIFNNSQVPTVAPEAAVAAVTTVSQILDANVTEFSPGDGNFTRNTERLTKAMEQFSLSNNNSTSLVQPNIAIQTLRLSAGLNKGVTLTSLRGSGGSDGLLPNRIAVNDNASELVVNTAADVQIFINVTGNSSVWGRVGFILYQNDNLFNSKTHKSQLNVRRRIISGSIADGTFDNVDFIFNPQYDSLFSLIDYACVFWDYTNKDWSTAGCTKVVESNLLWCSCNHTTNFAVLMSYKINYKYAQQLEIISSIGCALSILGLTITILFQIITRKKKQITWILVSLCISMLAFNILFISGLENRNAKEKNETAKDLQNTVPPKDIIDPPNNPLCTTVAALLHYFLLATFVWTAVYAAQMYILLIKVSVYLPTHFTRIASIIGWGIPALVVAITLGATYRLNSPLNYRQEEFCWLAALDQNGRFDINKPMLFAFLLPVGITLVINIYIFVAVAVLTIWRKNDKLTSTKRTSYLKKIISTLSVAVVLGLTWIFGYLMLINNDRERVIFSFVFCICSSTQGLQIFILYTLRSPVFLNQMAAFFDLLVSCKVYIHSEVYWVASLRKRTTRRYNERFRNFTDSTDQ